MPVSGMIRVTPPMMTKLCTPTMIDSPVASSFSKGRSQRMAMRSPVPTMSRKAATTAAAPSRPSSSAMAAKMKSVAASGMRWGLPRPGPSPKIPPAAMAKRPWMIW